MKYLIRFDDICPTMDWTQWKRAEELLVKYSIKPLLGVIPDCKDPELQIDEPRPDFWEWVLQKQREGYAIAMHGVYHVYKTHVRGMINNGYNSEFAGLSYEEQYELIKKGKEILLSHGVETDIFFAPSHSYDENTLKALSANGFRYMSDGKTHKPVTRHGIVCVPCKWSIQNILIKDNYRTFVFHAHEWVRPDKTKGYQHLLSSCQKGNVVVWEEYSNQRLGCFILESFLERVFLIEERYLYPILLKLARVKRQLFKCCHEK